MRMSEKCRNNNNSDNPLTSRRPNGGKNYAAFLYVPHPMVFRFSTATAPQRTRFFPSFFLPKKLVVGSYSLLYSIHPNNGFKIAND